VTSLSSRTYLLRKQIAGVNRHFFLRIASTSESSKDSTQKMGQKQIKKVINFDLFFGMTKTKKITCPPPLGGVLRTACACDYRRHLTSWLDKLTWQAVTCQVIWLGPKASVTSQLDKRNVSSVLYYILYNRQHGSACVLARCGVRSSGISSPCGLPVSCCLATSVVRFDGLPLLAGAVWTMYGNLLLTAN